MSGVRKKIHGNWVKRRLMENDILIKVIDSLDNKIKPEQKYREPKDGEIVLNKLSKYVGYQGDDEFQVHLPHIKYSFIIKKD